MALIFCLRLLRLSAAAALSFFFLSQCCLTRTSRRRTAATFARWTPPTPNVWWPLFLFNLLTVRKSKSCFQWLRMTRLIHMYRVLLIPGTSIRSWNARCRRTRSSGWSTKALWETKPGPLREIAEKSKWAFSLAAFVSHRVLSHAMLSVGGESAT